jgi:hypothetical protein
MTAARTPTVVIAATSFVRTRQREQKILCGVSLRGYMAVNNSPRMALHRKPLASRAAEARLSTGLCNATVDFCDGIHSDS